MTRRRAILLLALCAGLAAADEPAWVVSWLNATLPGAEAEHRDAYRARGDVPASWTQAQTRDLRFVVVAAESGAPLADVLLSSWQGRQHRFSGDDGSLGPLPWYVGSGGAVWVTASAPGRRTSAGWVRLRGDTVRLALAAETRRALRVQLQAGGKPVAEAAWALELEGEPQPPPALGEGVDGLLLAPLPTRRAGRSDARGTVMLRVQGPGRLRVSLPNVGCAEQPLPASGEAWTLALEPGGKTVAGTVVDGDGAPLAETSVFDTRSGARLTTGPDGRFRFRSCLDGLYCFQFLGPDAEEATDVLPSTYRGQPRDALTVRAR